MKNALIHVLILASSIDGYQQIEEQLVIENYKKNFGAFKNIPEEKFIEEARSISAKIFAGMKVDYIITDIGNELDNEGKNIAYALAAEVCASNFLAAHTPFLLTLPVFLSFPANHLLES